MANPSPRTFNLFRRWRDARTPLGITVWRASEGRSIFEALISGINSKTLRLRPLKGGDEVVLELEGAVLAGPLPKPKGGVLAIVIPSPLREDGLALLEPLGAKRRA
jgi:hypothetical protein